MIKITEAMLLAAGRGERMRPITDTIAKPMVEVGGNSMIGHILKKLYNHGIKRVVINSFYFAEKLENHVLGLQKKYSELSNLEIIFSREEELLDTLGGTVNALKYFETDHFFTLNGDAIWIDNKEETILNKMQNFFDPNKMDSLIWLHPRDSAISYQGRGDFNLDGNNHLIRFAEGNHDYIYASIQIIARKNLEEIPLSKISFAKLFLEENKFLKKEKLYGIAHECKWLHIGSPSELEVAKRFLETISNNMEM